MPEVFKGIVRHVLTAGGGVLVTKGYIDAGNLELAVGALVTLVGIAWSVVANKKK